MHRLMILLALSLTVVACGEDDDATIRGNTYQLISITGGLAGLNEDFSADAVFWQFSADDDLVITKTTSKLYSGPMEGEFKYEYDDATMRFGEDDTDQETWSSYSVNLSAEGDTLILDEGVELDGLLYTFYQR